MKRLPKINLIVKILIAIVLGIALGMVGPDWAARLCVTFNGIFSEFLGLMIPLIIIGFVAPAIAEVGVSAGKLLVSTVVLAYCATFIAAMLAYVTGILAFPSLMGDGLQMVAIDSGSVIEPWFTIEMPSPLPVMTALVLAFVMGLGIAFVQGNTLRNGFNEMREIVQKTINVAIIPLLPYYIFGIFFNMTVEGKVGTVMGTFFVIVAVIFALSVLLLLMQFSVAALVSGGNPLKMLRTMLPAYLTALGTQSSAATIPVTLRQALKLGVDERVAGFVIPLCATIHLSGSALKITACALALLIMHGQPCDIGLFVYFIAMLGITMVAAPGVPGGAIMAALGILHSILGFDEQMSALMIALYIAMDSFGTACNVTGDGALAVILNRFFGKKQQPD